MLDLDSETDGWMDGWTLEIKRFWIDVPHVRVCGGGVQFEGYVEDACLLLLCLLLCVVLCSVCVNVSERARVGGNDNLAAFCYRWCGVVFVGG